VLADGPRIRLDQVRAELGRKSLAPPRPLEDSGLLNLDERRRLSERTALTTALQQARNNRTVAARLLGVSRRTLYTKLEEHGLL
jgi:two-component system response regulator AtoC